MIFSFRKVHWFLCSLPFGVNENWFPKLLFSCQWTKSVLTFQVIRLQQENGFSGIHHVVKWLTGCFLAFKVHTNKKIHNMNYVMLRNPFFLSRDSHHLSNMLSRGSPRIFFIIIYPYSTHLVLYIVLSVDFKNLVLE